MISPDVLKVVVWPLVVLIFSIFFISLFKKDISSLISRLNKAKWPGGTETLFNFGDAEIDNPPQSNEKVEKSEKVPIKEDKIRWKNSGNLFWVGHDLM